MHISHNCSICGVAVEEFCGEHPNAIVDSVLVDEARELRSAQVLVDSFDLASDVLDAAHSQEYDYPQTWAAWRRQLRETLSRARLAKSRRK